MMNNGTTTEVAPVQVGKPSKYKIVVSEKWYHEIEVEAVSAPAVKTLIKKINNGELCLADICPNGEIPWSNHDRVVLQKITPTEERKS